jgi:hypothetical protein
MNKKYHIKADKLFLGYTIGIIHRMVDDAEALKRYGSKHGIYRHNTDFLFFLKEYYGDSIYKIALLHILIDLEILGEIEELQGLIDEFS